MIIGAGIGGITTSIYLAKQGYSVRVYEKNSTIGGRCSQITREGHRFDLGATIYLMPRIYQEVLQTLGYKIEDLAKTVPLETLYRLYFADGTRIDFSTRPDKFKETLEQIEAGAYPKAEALRKSGYRLYQLALKQLIGRNFFHFFEFATLRNAWLLFQLKVFVRHTVFIRRFFAHTKLRIAFTFQNIYVGQNPFRAPALFSMIPAAELTEGSLFPLGGMSAIAQKLVEIAQNLGVNFILNEPVVRIKTTRNKAEGIILQNGSTIRASVIVANADLPYVYRELLPDRWQSWRLDKLTYTCSAIVMHWGLDKEYPQLSHHSVFLSDDYRNNLNQIFRNQSISSSPSFYVHAPVRSDPSAAPAGFDTLSIIIPSGHLRNENGVNWNKLKNLARAHVIKRLKEEGLEDIEEHIRFEMSYLPQTWKSLFNLTRGATFGSLGHQIRQMGYFRPHNRHRKYCNLYFVGGSTHPGNGVPLVLLSAKLTSERIAKDQKHA